MPIVPNELIPKDPPRQAIVKMHNSYQAIRPDQALAIVRKALPADHSVVGWLSTGDFDQPKNHSVRNAPSPKGVSGRSASTPVNNYTLYIKQNEIVVSPLHARLQGDFVNHLAKKSVGRVQENLHRVDLRYRDAKRGVVLVEVKPTEPSTVRYAIRLAMGQLLDYRQNTKGDPALLIVIDDDPKDEDLQLALSNGFGLAWRSSHSFAYAWPN